MRVMPQVCASSRIVFSRVRLMNAPVIPRARSHPSVPALCALALNQVPAETYPTKLWAAA